MRVLARNLHKTVEVIEASNRAEVKVSQGLRAPRAIRSGTR